MRTKFFTLLAAFCLAPSAGFAYLPEGQPAPRAEMKLLRDGKVRDFPGWEAYRGKAVVLEFWATWCDGCVANIPHLNDMAKAFAGKPVEFLSVTGETEAAVTDFLKDHPVAGTIGVGAKDAAEKFGVGPIPQTVVLDKEGRIARYTVPEELTEEGLARLLEKGSADGIPAKYSGAGKEKAGTAAAPGLFSVSVAKESGEKNTYGYGTDGPSFFRDYKGMELKYMLADAYGLNPSQVEVSTALPDTRYNFKVLGPREYRDELIPLFIQTLKTVYRADMLLVKKEIPVLLLKYDKTAQRPGLNTAKTKGQVSYGNGFFRTAGAGSGELAGFLAGGLGRPVIDETGLDGIYDIKLTWKGGREAIEASLKEQLGMTLEPAAREMDVLQAFPAAGRTGK